MVLKTVHDKIDEIPEEFRPLYTERNGKMELTGIVGVKTEADVARVTKSLESERNAHKETKEKLKLWGELDPVETLSKLDKLPALEKAAAGKLDDVTIADLASKQAEAMLKSKLGPVERQLAQTAKERDEYKNSMQQYVEKDIRRSVADDVRAAGTKLKMHPEAIEDAIEIGYRVLQRTEDGKVVTRDGAGVVAGVDAESWLTEMRPKRPHWWPASQGGDSRGSGNGGGSFLGGKNPWSADNWNMTEQGRYLREHGKDKAAAAAASAGSSIGATAPPKKK